MAPESKVPFSKYIVMCVFLGIFAITVGGYALFYQAQKQLAQKDREIEIFKEKSMRALENYNEIEKKYDGVSNQMTQVNKDYQTLLQKQQECKEKQEELQSKLDVLQRADNKPSTEQGHPVKLLESGDMKPQESAPSSEVKPAETTKPAEATSPAEITTPAETTKPDDQTKPN